MHLFRHAEKVLAYMAIPFVLSVYQTFTVEAIRLLRQDGQDLNSNDPSLIPLETIHSYMTKECGLLLPPMEVGLFDFIRQVRNRIVHYAGLPGSNLRSAYAELPGPARALWRLLAGDDFRVSAPRTPMELTARDLIPALAVTKRLSKAINGELGRRVSRALWAQLVIEDYRAQQPGRFGERAQRLRRVHGHANNLYRALALSQDDLEEVLREM